MARPTFLVIGAMKCGTTSLHHYLGQHPEIQIPTLKELNFFSGPPGNRPYPAGSKRIERLDNYERLFDPRFRARGEVSPNYAIHPLRTGVPERIRDVTPDVKLIYLVRDPIDRTVAQYRLAVSTANERRSLAQALSDLSDPYSLYTCPTFYTRQLEQYLHRFPLEQILVIDQADLLHSQHATLREIFRFLSVDDSFVSPRFYEKLNTSDGHRTYSRFVVLSRWARGTPLLRLPRGLRVFMRRSVERLVSRPLEAPALDDELRLRLQELYADDVSRLRQLTGKTFPTWSI
jgi:sulfotransferase family protein